MQSCLLFALSCKYSLRTLHSRASGTIRGQRAKAHHKVPLATIIQRQTSNRKPVRLITVLFRDVLIFICNLKYFISEGIHLRKVLQKKKKKNQNFPRVKFGIVADNNPGEFCTNVQKLVV